MVLASVELALFMHLVSGHDKGMIKGRMCKS